MTLLSSLRGFGRLGNEIKPYAISWGAKPNAVFNLTRGMRQPRLNSSRSGGMKIAPENKLDVYNENMGPGLIKSMLFTASFCSVTLMGVTAWQYENLRSLAKGNFLRDWTQKNWNKMGGWQEKEGSYRRELNKWWNNQSEGKQMFWVVCFINSVVFACWKQPSLQRTMMHFFCSNPAAKAVCWPMLLSTFSHCSFIHLAMNMYVLHSFSSGVCGSLGKEQFVGLYLCGGVISSLASSVFKVATRSPGLSLGASGAIMAMLGYFCSHYPDAQLGFVFIPGFTFSADTALKAIMCLDAIGMVMRWRLFDHAAHLGGAVFGLLHEKYGGKFLWGNQNSLIIAWHELRTEIDKSIKTKKDGGS